VIVAIHQPEHLPWLGFFDKMRRADLFVFLDHVPFRKNYFQNRNRVRSASGATWVTVPVLTKGHAYQPLNEVQINEQGSPRWKQKYWASVEQSYAGSPYWKEYAEGIRRCFETPSPLLCDLNITLIEAMRQAFGIEVQTARSSALGVDGTRSELLLEICRKTGATEYLSGISGKEYLDLDLFRAAGIRVEFQEFHHPLYRQRYEPFMPLMSAVDLLFNHGAESFDVLRGIGVEVIQEVFP